MFVTVELLDKLEACEDQRNRFAELFPFGVELSRTVIVRHAQDFDWRRCARNLASAHGYAAYRRTEKSAQAARDQAVMPADAAYRQAVDAEWAVYQQAEKQAGAAYNQAEKQAGAAYNQAVDAAWAVYDRSAESAEAAYKLARANAFADVMGL